MIVKSEENLDFVRNQRCQVCGRWPSDPDHLRTRGAGGDDSLENLMPLCRRHHTERGTIGIRSFVKKYSLPVSWESGWPKRTDL